MAGKPFDLAQPRTVFADHKAAGFCAALLGHGLQKLVNPQAASVTRRPHRRHGRILHVVEKVVGICRQHPDMFI